MLQRPTCFLYFLPPLFFCLSAVFCGCSRHHEIDYSSMTSFEASTKSSVTNKARARDLTNAVYHLSTGTWIIPQKDPYDLNRMLEARRIVGTSSEDIPIKTTHYAIKFYPKNEKEQWMIELAEGVNVDYTPFNYEPVTYDQNRELGPEPNNRGLILDDCRYMVFYPGINEDDSTSTIECYRIPVLYTVWPIEKPLPDDIEYAIDHSVFIPDYRSTDYDEDKRALLKSIEREAIYLALGFYPIEFSNPTRSNDLITLQGYVYNEDTKLDSLVGQHNLKIRFQLGSNMWDTYVQQNGFFSITEAISTAASYKHILQHTKWKLTNDLSTNPFVFTWGNVSYWWSSLDDTPILTPSVGDVTYDVLPAVNFYYYGSHSIRTWHYNDGIRIIIPGIIGEHPSTFHFASSPTYITVFEDYYGYSERIMGAVLHELGHFTMYCECGGYLDYTTNYSTIDRLLRESYASYVGWYLTETRYAGMGYTETPGLYSFTGQARQTWIKTHYSPTDAPHMYYSPLFVDLVDTFNQHNINSSYNNDSISIGPYIHTIIREIAAQCKTWDDMKNALDDYVGVFYTQSQFDSFCMPYNYWYEHI